MLLKLPDRALISFGFACQQQLVCCLPPPFHSPTLHSVSAKSRDKMHNNFIHSGRCHKSVLNRVNNFVLRLPGQFLNCQESCCESGMSFRPTPPSPSTPLHVDLPRLRLLHFWVTYPWCPGALGPWRGLFTPAV